MLSKFGSLLASGLMLFPFTVSSSPVVPHHLRAADFSQTVTPAQVQTDLGKFLSKGTQIFGPSSPSFANIEVVIEVTQEADVAKIVSRHIGIIPMS